MSRQQTRGSEAIIAALIKKGARMVELRGTNVLIVQYNGRNLYFTHNLTPATPFIYGVFATQEVYTEAILTDGGLHYGAPSSKQNVYHVLVTTNGYLTVLRENGGAGTPTDVTEDIGESLRAYAMRVLRLFPHAAFVAFSVNVHAPAHGTRDRDEDYLVSQVSFELDRFIAYSMHKDGETRAAADVIANLIVNP